MNDVGIVAKEWFEENGEDLARALLRCFFNGAIIKHPDFVLLGEPCRTEGLPKFIPGEPDTWFVHYWGAVEEKFTCFDVASAAPFYLPYIAFRRRGKLRVRHWEQFLREPIRKRQFEEVT
jgi:hypothetical protein